MRRGIFCRANISPGAVQPHIARAAFLAQHVQRRFIGEDNFLLQQRRVHQRPQGLQSFGNLQQPLALCLTAQRDVEAGEQGFLTVQRQRELELINDDLCDQRRRGVTFGEQRRYRRGHLHAARCPLLLAAPAAVLLADIAGDTHMGR
ncbi:hypothetical protein D3C87_1742210 [compost metagenome]